MKLEPLKGKKVLLGYKFKRNKTTDEPEFGFFENDTKSAVAFYARYGLDECNAYELFKKEQPEIYKKWVEYLKETKICACIFRWWLFEYCFADVIK